MSMFGVFDVAASGIAAQTVRMNTIASNLANANSAAGSEAEAYRAKEVIFKAQLMHELGKNNSANMGVRVVGVVDSSEPLKIVYEPNHPQANSEGYVFYPNVNMVEEMANMISTSRSFQNNVNVIETTKKLMERTLALGQ